MGQPIVVLEDEKQISTLILYKLKKSGFEVHHATNGVDGLKLINEVKPSLVILDVMMPIMNGHEVVIKLKENEETRSIPILMLSALSNRQDVIRGLQLGADDYLTKPFSPQELIVRINKLLERSKGEKP